MLSTGSGKTHIISELVEKCNTSTIIVANRTALISQLSARLRRPHSIYCAEANSWSIGHTTIGTVQSLSRAEIPATGLVVIDECHNLSPQYLPITSKAKRIVGFTATPFRNNKYIYGEKEFFPRVSFTRSISFMFEKGYLVPPTMKSSKKAFDTSTLRLAGEDYVLEDIERLTLDETLAEEQVKDAIPRLDGRKKIVWVCSSIAHAEMVAARIPEALCIHSKSDDSIDDFRKQGRHAVSVMMLTEGIDIPDVDAIVLMRPTRSVKLYIQVVGRGLRPSPGKENCLVLDYGQVIENCGPLDAPYVGNAKEKPELTPLWLCINCYSYNLRSSQECAECHTPKPTAERDRETKLAERHKEAEILSVPTAYNVDSIEVRTHLARSTGNKCIRIDYYCSNVIGVISEYFSNHPFSWRNGVKRLGELGAFFNPASFDESYTIIKNHEPCKVERIPKHVYCTREGKYLRVRHIDFA